MKKGEREKGKKERLRSWEEEMREENEEGEGRGEKRGNCRWGRKRD